MIKKLETVWTLSMERIYMSQDYVLLLGLCFLCMTWFGLAFGVTEFKVLCFCEVLCFCDFSLCKKPCEQMIKKGMSKRKKNVK